MNDKIYLRILKEIAKENGYKVTRVIDGIFELKKGNKNIYIKGKDFGINSALANKITQNKAVTFEILYRNGIKAVPHYEIYYPELYAIFGNQKKRNKQRIEVIIKKEKLPLVIKPATGSSGKGVELVSSKREINRSAKELFKRSDEVVLSPFRVIDHEYRTIVLNGKVELIFDKVRADKHEFRHNLCFGSNPEILKKTDKKYKKLETMAKRVVKTLKVTFASVDIIETEENGLEVLEVNSLVSLGHFGEKSKKNYEIAKSIYKKAWKKGIK